VATVGVLEICLTSEKFTYFPFLSYLASILSVN
jgi:hypothetical protein